MEVRKAMEAGAEEPTIIPASEAERPFGWPPNLMMGIPRIDDAHRVLISLFDRMGRGLRDGMGGGELVLILAELKAYAERHFCEEEAYFRQYNIPSALSHEKEHEEFVMTVKSCRASLETGSRAVATRLVYYLAYWLSRHIAQEDRVLERVAAKIRAAERAESARARGSLAEGDDTEPGLAFACS